MTISQLVPEEPLSPELVLVLAPEVRARVLASLGAPVWPAPRQRVVDAPAQPDEPFVRAVGVALAGRLVSLGLVFVAVTAVTLAMSLVAHAVR